MFMKTYIQLNIGTRGIHLNKLVHKIESLGFKSSLGEYDFEYVWNNVPKKENVIELGNKVIWALSESDSTFRMVTK